ncbi:hypothetical protein MGYG_00689 [Nannizzia gypsea CBS 118893]|uniref:ubiquitinyl hydrolase 1 n=1 Tax=Arthroderma gypseum (strain ATCC MYA-4604 / CBS 118893) TaxID=535722 RepID=E5R147_ARTGP|nr:hypothetical protein MGYG_00689 [Nannizzia gypsea CBS 118893]EFQ97651.1 hypothetical protein MGYG_00689 [Nannizzia gypsea CBS 118893]
MGFPRRSRCHSYTVFTQPSFRESLSNFLECASTESIKRFAASVMKGGAVAFENRDTTDPALITQMLMTLLEANGSRIFPPLLRKRVRDEVSWAPGGGKPWRRLPFWLVLRVGIERHLHLQFGAIKGRAYYKFLLCLMFSAILGSGTDSFSPDQISHLTSKLARRLAKLEVHREKALHNDKMTYNRLFDKFEHVFQNSISDARNHIANTWSKYKKSIRRRIPRLPLYADEQSQYLSLTNSEKEIEKVLLQYRADGASRSKNTPSKDFSPKRSNAFKTFANSYNALSRLEIVRDEALQSLGSSTEETCMEIAAMIQKYYKLAAPAYDGDPEQKSIMVLNMMVHWMELDMCATKLYPLLLEYHPGISSDLLDVLQLSSLQDLIRLNTVQEYIDTRCTRCLSRMTIFEDPTEGCFAEKYFDLSEDTFKLQTLHSKIVSQARKDYDRKVVEWQEKSEEHEALQRMVTLSSCTYVSNRFGGVDHDENCEKCDNQRRANRMTIKIHEHPLPDNPVHAKVVVFELQCPEAFKSYRNTTWLIFGIVACPHEQPPAYPKLLVSEYKELSKFFTGSSGGIVLASTTKSLLFTHYRGVHFPVRLDDICFDNNLRVKYYDTVNNIFPNRQSRFLSFSHHLQMPTLTNSPFSSITPQGSLSGTSSYEIIASQPSCPAGLNTHEFLAYKSLFSGVVRRWPTILIELGSSNLNFSTKGPSTFICQLSIQAGPRDKKDIFRVVHKIFRDEVFCIRLIKLLEERLIGVASNWRETDCMEMLITLILRLCVLCPLIVLERTVILLKMVQDTLLKWTRLLRKEICAAQEPSVIGNYSDFAFTVALLLRRTFVVYPENVPGYTGNMTESDIRCFIEASISLQDHAPPDLKSLSHFQWRALVRDLKMVYRMRSLLLKSLKNHPGSLGAVITEIWAQSTLSVGQVSDIQLLDGDEWAQLVINPTNQTKSQVVHFHYLEGHLLVDGKPLATLPANYRNAVVLDRLFGKQRLQVYPSSLHGMSYVLPFEVNQQRIHIGFRDGKPFVRAESRTTIYEFLPYEIFGTKRNFDLPGSLVENCIHWLDLKSGTIKIRRKPNIWHDKDSNWEVDFHNRKAWRRTVALVDPHSQLFRLVANVFDGFEHPGYITIYQPASKNLSVELRRLELDFIVTKSGLLRCKQLNTLIDMNQDAGTWYGLKSKLVLRDVVDIEQRSILVPMGPLHCSRNGIHVSVFAENLGAYGRFFINTSLGRLDCPAEPWTLYAKAQFHAYTSFVLPDELTGRTGTEEAVHCLKSGYSQPWTTLNPGPLGTLQTIALLAPTRVYYPPGSKTVQHTTWNENLTPWIQHEVFSPLVERICETERTLRQFSSKLIDQPAIQSVSNDFLMNRAYRRRNTYQRPNAGFDDLPVLKDAIYQPRDRFQGGLSRSNVFEISSLVKNWSTNTGPPIDLIKKMESWPTIGGYCTIFDKVLLSDMLDVQFDVSWGSIVNFCRNSEQTNKYHLMTMMALMSFSNSADMEIIRTLLLFATIPSLKSLIPPNWVHYKDFRYNQQPTVVYLRRLISHCCVPYTGNDWGNVRLSLKSRKKFEADEREHKKRVEADAVAFSEFIFAQWPCPEPSTQGMPNISLLNVQLALKVILPDWSRIFQNSELSNYLAKVRATLLSGSFGKYEQFSCCIKSTSTEIFHTGTRGEDIPTLAGNLLRKSSRPYTLEPRPTKNTANACLVSRNGDVRRGFTGSGNRINLHNRFPSQSSSFSQISELEDIIGRIKDSPSLVRQQYADDLMASLKALKSAKCVSDPISKTFDESTLYTNIGSATQKVECHAEHVRSALNKDDLRFRWLHPAGLWPCMTMVTLLEQLRSTFQGEFGTGMKESLIALAVEMVHKQRFLRIKDAFLRGKDRILEDEQNCIPHCNWDPAVHPDWLLLQIDADICIRPNQIEVAHATIAPSSKANSVLQMNMGQGKTSCIIPMVAAVLSDTTKLLRVIVPKALLLQTSQVLQGKLGGLVGREIRHVPFSRRTPTSIDMIQSYLNIHKAVMSSAGVMVALPEHMMSFQLSGLQRLVDNKLPEARKMIKINDWMQAVCRDVLDECDFTLAPRTQLIYPSGTQSTVDGHPHRWQTAEKLLELVSGHIWGLWQKYPGSIEVIQRPKGGFPIVYFLRKDVEETLMSLVVRDIIDGRTSIIPVRGCRRSELVDIKTFISEASISPKVVKRVSSLFPDNSAARQNMYLLRGLLVHRILLLTLKKRWNVQYGLHPLRDPIAVPFIAKGVPSEQAEWGHPDVAILFTCLAFYLGGLEISQVRQCLDDLLKSSDPSTIYEQWITNSETLPEILRDWNLINTEDESQVCQLWDHLRYQMPLINYFLNQFVFPKHAKQFKVKLQASGWDIPLSSAQANPGTMTTGFSGTNDNRTILPLTIKQQDLGSLVHTNAEVLTFVLRARNYVVAKDIEGRRLTETGLLTLLRDMGLRILIDAGAQILEMDNLSLVKEWLRVDWTAPAAMYFDSENKPYIIYRNGYRVPLLASPYADNLEGCLVYLDEAHTRGTDLKIPADAVGALTLGLGQTKDHTVQAAMRLRQLGTTQSITFFAPPEVHHSILDSRKIHPSIPVSAADVVYWLLVQTCIGIEQIQPLYFSQGMDFCRRRQAAVETPKYLTDQIQRQQYCKALQQEEMQTLQELFRPIAKLKSKATVNAYAPHIATHVKALEHRKKGFQDFGDAVHSSTLQEVEQEREVAYEVEAIREVQKAPRFKALAFPGLHEDIKLFCRAGTLTSYSSAYQQAFIALKNTGMGQKHSINSCATSSKLFLSREFSKTIRLPVGEYNDNYMRQVNWILWNPSIQAALVIIPEEAEMLIPYHQGEKRPQTHLLTYAAPVTRGMRHFSNLDFYSIPPLPTNWKAPSWLTIELGILAGRVYFDYSEYGPICQYLGCTGSMTEVAADVVESEKTSKEPEENMDTESVIQTSNLSFTPKPLSFLQEWLALRRKGQEFSNTPMGYICQGKMLNEKSPFFSSGPGIRANIPKLKAADSSSENGDLESPEASDCEPEDTGDQKRGQVGKGKSFADNSSESEESDVFEDAGSNSEHHDVSE